MTIRVRLAPAIAGLFVVVAAGPGQAQAPAMASNSTLQLMDYLDWEDVQDPRISPDGKQVVFTRRWVDKQNDRWSSAVWIMDADGSRQRFLLEGSTPRWSPDGTRIVYTGEGEPSGTQVFVKWVNDPAPATQLTRVAKSPSNVTWSPDGKTLAFTMLVPEKPDWTVRLPSAPEGAKWTAAPRVVTSLQYRRDRQGFNEDGYRHLFVLDAAGGTPRQVTSGNWDHGAPEWTPDGQSLLFSSLRTPDSEYAWRESEIYTVNVASGAIRQLTNRKGPDANPTVSPNGRLIAYTGYDSTGATWQDSRLYVMNADGSNPRVLTDALDRSPSGLHWAADNSGIYFSAEDRGSRNLHFVSLDGRHRQVTTGEHVLAVSDVHRSGLVVGTASSPQAPSDVVTLTLRDPKPRKLTDVNGDVLAGKRLAQLEEIWYPSADGLRIQGWIVKPPDFDSSRKYPLMLDIHGGPHSMYNVGFSFARQEHAANGYVVLYTNPRGSTGYGSEFGNAIKNAYPGKDYDDLMAGVDSLIGRGYIDENNLFVHGCSGGGVLTSWIVGQTDRFAAASANCPVTNWLSFVGTTDGASWYYNFEKMPWEDPSEHLRRSPLMHVGNVKTPTMLMTGVNDLRTPMPQTEEFYQALKMRKVPTAMVRFNEEWHGTSSKPSNFLRTQTYLRAWFEEHGTHRKNAVTN